ncbi:MAG: hypothetical protein H0U86_15565, partial [Chloroflexi bacterium]|nr:hypothetical protein [Chloroflexota bacterium]
MTRLPASGAVALAAALSAGVPLADDVGVDGEVVLLRLQPETMATTTS